MPEKKRKRRDCDSSPRRMEAADGERGATTGACCNQSCGLSSSGRPEERRSTVPVTRRMKSEGTTEPRLAALSERGPVFNPDPLVRQIKDLTLAIGLSSSLTHPHSLSLSFSLSLLFTLFLLSPSAFPLGRSVFIRNPHSLIRYSLAPFLSILPVSVSFFYISIWRRYVLS